MKRLFLLIVMLAVGSYALTSCEKSSDEEYVKPETEQDNGNEEGNEEGTTIDETMILGLWERTATAEGYSSRYTWRFYDDKSGYQTIDSYNEHGKIIGLSRGPFTYYFRDGLLYILYAHSKEAIEWHYNFEGDELRMHSDMDESNNTFIFTRATDAPGTLVGDWSVTTVVDGKRQDAHIVFTTPADGNTYTVTYNEAGSASEQVVHGQEFKYTFDNSVIKIAYISTDGTTDGTEWETQYYYRLEGSKLYLSTSKGGSERCYTNFKMEQGL